MQNTAVITGGSSGIGLELARVFAERWHDLVLIARPKNSSNQLTHAGIY